MQDFDAIPELPAGVHAENFEGGAQKFAKGTIILEGPGACFPRKILKNHPQR